MFDVVSSIKDPRVLHARELQSAKGRKQHKQCLLFGREQVEWADQVDVKLETVFSLEPLEYSSWPIVLVTEGVMKRISDTSYVVPIMAVADIPEKKRGREDFIVVADQVKDFGSLGSLIRTAHAFSVDTIFFSIDDVDPFQGKVIDSSRGLVFKSHFEFEPSVKQTIALLKERGYQLVVNSPHVPTVQSQVELTPFKPIALVVGNELHGVEQDFIDAADVVIKIPMSMAVDSLNEVVSAQISSYDLIFKQVLGMLREKVVTNLGRQVSAAGKLIRLIFDQLISQKTDLSGEQVILLMIMHCDGAMTQEQITQDVGIIDNEDALGTFLKPLKEKEFINSEYQEYSITELGNQFLAQIWPLVEQANYKIVSQFSENELTVLHKILTKLQIGCDDAMLEKNNKN